MRGSVDALLGVHNPVYPVSELERDSTQKKQVLTRAMASINELM